jgi:hypothetical protein
MRPMRHLAVMACVAGLLPLSFSQSTATPQISPAAAESHVGQTATVCGKVVGERMSKYGVGGHGRPITLDLDKPEPNAIFHAVLFSSSSMTEDQLKTTYDGKQVCVTGKITKLAVPTIMASDPSQFQVQATNKP